ncbi:MAG TPA: TA system VapC family ribonuclease toxin [Armatimonadota bacterium]|nr:TA system VapC family ribonuclease toxin [Armatimonadota bacterium]
MIIPDTNLLVYSYDSKSPYHDRARSWWEGVLSGPEPVGIPWIVVLAFTRLVTHPTLNENPMTVVQAREAVMAWLSVSHVRILETTPATIDLFFNLLTAAGTGGNLSTDAMIAALATEYGGRVFSNDRDFGRFPGIKWQNPLAKIQARRP